MIKSQLDNHDTVDLFKFIGSIFIFLMHINIWGDSLQLRFQWELLSRWAVPFFFIISSFFLFRKEGDNANIDNQSLRIYVQRVFSLYISWFIINVPSIIYLRLVRPGIAKLSTWIAFIKGIILSSSFAGSWFLLSSIVSAYLLFLLSKRFKTITCVLFAIIPYTLCLLTSAYGGVLTEKMSGVLTWLCFPLNIFGGLLYFSIGKLIYEKMDIIQKAPLSILGLLSVLFFVLYFIEIKQTMNEGIYWSSDYAIAIIPLALSLSLFCLKSTLKVKKSKQLRAISTIVYCAQGNILCAAPFICKFLGIPHFFVRGIIGLFMMSLMVAIILFVQKTNKSTFIKALT